MNPKRLRTQWQRLPERELRRLQALKLRHYLRATVLPFSAHYRELFREQRLNPDSIRTLDDLPRIPFTTKSELLDAEAAKDFVLRPDPARLARRPSTMVRALFEGGASVRRGFEEEFRPVMMTCTTGRSADPVPFLFTRHDLRNLSLAGSRGLQMYGLRPESRVLNIFPYAPHLAFWQCHYAATAFGVFSVGTGGGKVAGTEGNVRLLRKIKPNAVAGMPTFLYHVLTQAVEEGARCEDLSLIILGGEKAPAGMRRKLRSLAAQLGAKRVSVVATYGLTEAKMAWTECPGPDEDSARSGYHVFPDLALIEVVDPATGALLPAGSPGELVFTPLDARGTVVLRYRTGDVTNGGLEYGPCPHCGRVLPRLVGEISRKSDVKEMHLDKLKGTLVDFNQLAHVLDNAEHVGAWQLEIRKVHDDPLDLDELILHVSKLDGVPNDSLATLLNERFSARTEMRVNRVDFHTGEELRALQGVGVALKEQLIVDHRPRNSIPMNKRAVIVAGVRTPFCKAGTDLAALAADELGRVAVNALLARTGLDPRIDRRSHFRVRRAAADAANIARVIALRSGIPKEVPAFTVHRNCASGCEAVTQACDKIAAGRGDTIWSGGVESMSQIPMLFRHSAARKFTALGRAKTFGEKLAAAGRVSPVRFQPARRP